MWAGQFSSQAERRGALVIAKVISKSGCVHLEREDCDDQSLVSVAELQGCPSLVPRPSASRARTAYVTFEPLSDSQLSDKGSKVTYAVRARLADGLGTRLGLSRCRAVLLPAVPLPGCPAAGLSRCRAVPLLGCPTAGLSRCRAVPLPGCPAAGLSRCRAVPLPSCPAARLSR